MQKELWVPLLKPSQGSHGHETVLHRVLGALEIELTMYQALLMCGTQLTSKQQIHPGPALVEQVIPRGL